MRIPENRFNKRSIRYNRNSRKGRKILILVVVLIGFAVSSYFYYNSTEYANRKKIVEVEKTLDQLWNEGSYKQLAEKCEDKILENPLDPAALIYAGFAYFYLGIGQFTMEEKIPLLNKSIIFLRKVLILKTVPLKGKVEYILGKAYYHKGRHYLDLSIKYLKRSLDHGYEAEDSYKYLGLAYSELGMYKEGVVYFLKSLDKKPDDMLYLALGQTYYKMEDDQTSEKYLLLALKNTHDFPIEQKCRFLLGKIFLDRDDYAKAEEQYNNILEKNRNSANAHYYLGEIYSKLQKKVKARAEWRKALEIDPSHYGALLRLY